MANNARTPNQNKALAWYCQEFKLIPQLSAHPVYYFKNKDGKESTANMSGIMTLWNNMRKAKKEKAER